MATRPFIFNFFRARFTFLVTSSLTTIMLFFQDCHKFFGTARNNLDRHSKHMSIFSRDSSRVSLKQVIHEASKFHCTSLYKEKGDHIFFFYCMQIGMEYSLGNIFFAIIWMPTTPSLGTGVLTPILEFLLGSLNTLKHLNFNI